MAQGTGVLMNSNTREPAVGTSICIRPLTANDIPFGMWLKTQAGWNQTEADWHRCLALEPSGCFVAELGGVPAGTTTTCVFGSVAWVAMVLVRADVRGRGIGKALMTAALGYLEGRHVRSIRLDATPLGQPLYEKLGFASQFIHTRYDGILPPCGERVAGVEPVRRAQLSELAALDQSVTGTDRSKLLAQLYVEQSASFLSVCRDGRVAGYVSSRPRAHALQIGPCIASPDDGVLLLREACRLYGGQRVVMDIPNDNSQAIGHVEWLGLVPTRPLLRMNRGERVLERIENLWVSYGPEKG
jgi:GNAT superfamily N-acetyltransferase